MNDLINATKNATKFWWVSLLVGIFALVMGVWSLFYPGDTIVALTFAFIIMFYISGIAEIIFAASNSNMSGWGWILAGGIIDLLFGIMLTAMPWPVVTTVLVYYIGFWIMFRSIWGIGIAFGLKQVPGWGWLLAMSIIGLIFSFVYLISPGFNSLYVVAMASAAFIVYGIFRIYYSFVLQAANSTMKKAEKGL